jgi:hypothetical protein
MFKPGDLVKQAQNIFTDRQIGGMPMIVVQTWSGRGRDAGHSRVDVLVFGSVRTFHDGELEIYRPRK